METIWFILVALMLTAYTVLDGFDLGVGIVAPLVARGHEQRRLVLRSIGPVWDGNEVWLIAAGGALFFAFPLLYASSFSGFYLPLMMVLWLLMLRGIGVELRAHVEDPLAWSAFDFVFSLASLLLAVFFGAAVGNVVRGVPLGADGYFFEALWTDFRVGPHPGILDWYTVLTGVLALVTLGVHGAHYLAVKMEGEIRARSRRTAAAGWIALTVLTAASLAATLYVRPQVLDNFRSHPWGWIIPVLVFGSLAAMPLYRARGKDRALFLASTVYIIGMLGGVAFALYPYLLPASTDPSYGLTIHNAKTGAYSLRIGLIWWSFGIVLAIGYFTFLYRSFRGKVPLGEEGGY
ncbi:MAG TPA: cytochrome d ubiquinol oxidase subunit II [Thermoanaerobaculia bacterium]|jgi:cytochrome d ubiquinol oxidase subunit II|nr:cytochrome d ubiquinol oxidase subunit II [Thermoanaerobaculia bacterium]